MSEERLGSETCRAGSEQVPGGNQRRVRVPSCQGAAGEQIPGGNSRYDAQRTNTDSQELAAELQRLADIEQRILDKCSCPFQESHERKRDSLLDAAAYVLAGGHE